MIVIIEGPDGAGKTMLAQSLATTYGLCYHHEGPPPLDVTPLVHYGGLLERAAERAVFDRFALGERVYGALYRHDDRLGADGWRVFHRLVTARCAIEIMCLAPYEMCRTAWQSGRPEMVKDETLFRRIYDRWLELTAGQYLFDWAEEDAWPTLQRFLESRSQYPLPRRVIGDPHADILLVGDRGSDTQGPTCNLPFFGTDQSSGYLTAALDAAGLPEERLAFVNATQHDWFVPNWPECPHVIALGHAAARECLQRQVPHHTVPHPQFWRRFHHHNVQGYARLLARAAQGDTP